MTLDQWLFNRFCWGGALLFVALLVAVLLFLLRRQRLDEDRRQGRRMPRHSWALWEAAIEEVLLQHGRVEEEMLPDIPLSIRPAAMRRYVEEHGEDALVYRGDPPRIELREPERLQAFLSRWKAAWETVDSETAFESVVGELADQICALMGFLLVDRRIYRSLVAYVVHAPALRLRFPPRFPLVFVRQREFDHRLVDDLRSLMGILNVTGFFALLVDLHNNPPPNDRRQNLKLLVRDTTYDFIVLNGTDLRRLFTARDPERRLIDIVLTQVDLTVVSPYVISGPVPETMFFGRDNELKTIVRKIGAASFAVVGGRKIGKTSILAKVHRTLEEMGRYVPLYLDCQSVRDYTTFFDAVEAMWGVELDEPTAEGFRRLMVEMARKRAGNLIVVLLDEVDALLHYDGQQGEPLLRALRALSQEGFARFVLCGERGLYAQLHNPRSPLFNFCDTIHLGPLREAAVRQMILDPMRTMGISLERQEEMVYRIIDLSSRHPNLVQYICHGLIQEINRRGTRAVTMADLEAVERSSAFAEYFVEVTWGNTTPLERLFTLMLMDAPPQLTLAQLEALAWERGVPVTREEVEAAVAGLRLYALLRREGAWYQFTNKAFAQIVRRSQDVGDLFRGLRARWLQEREAVSAG